MKPTWDKLADEFNSGSKVLVADVDCTAGGKDLCETYGVQGFPTIKYFNPPDEEGEDYEGGRGFDELKAFAEKLGPGCSASTIENCTEEQKAEIAELDKGTTEATKLRQEENAQYKVASKDFKDGADGVPWRHVTNDLPAPRAEFSMFVNIVWVPEIGPGGRNSAPFCDVLHFC